MPASLGINMYRSTEVNLRTVQIRKADDGKRELRGGFFREDRDDLGEIKRAYDKPLMLVSGDAADPMMPWSNYARQLDLWLWHAWREDKDLCATPDATSVVRISLDAPPVKIIRPALTLEDASLDIFFIKRAGVLALARFTTPKDGSGGGSGAIAWEHAIPAGVVGAYSTLGHPGKGSFRRLTLVSQEESALTIHLLHMPVGDKPAKVTAAPPAAGYFSATGAEPGLLILEDGGSLVSVLVTKKPGGTEIGMLEAHFDPDGRPLRDPTFKPLRTLPAPMVAGAITHQVVAGMPPVREWFAALADGTVLHAHSEAKGKLPRGLVVRPIEMVRCTQSLYFLCEDPLTGELIVETAQ